MLDPKLEAILQRLLTATQEGRLHWNMDADGYFSAPLGMHNQSILIRRMFLEATNQIGADPYFVELHMPGLKTRFSITSDSDGWRYISRILDSAFPGGWNNNLDQAIAFLDLQLPDQSVDGGSS
jgi:hypothetical protein